MDPIQEAIEEALRRIGEHAEAQIGTITALWGGRWGAHVLDAVSGRRRTTISFDAQDGTTRDQIIERAGVELQVWLKLCGLCRRPCYVTREDAGARVLYFDCTHCGRYRIDGDEVTNLRKMVARGDPEAMHALPKLTKQVQEHQNKPELPFIENWRADARE